MGRFPKLHRVRKLYTICLFGKYNCENFYSVFPAAPCAGERPWKTLPLVPTKIFLGSAQRLPHISFRLVNTTVKGEFRSKLLHINSKTKHVLILLLQQISIANEIGIPSSKSALLIGYQAITNTAARIAFGRLVNNPRMDKIVSVQIMGLMLAVNATLFPLAKTYSSLVVYVVVFGCFDGSLAVMFGMGTLHIVGERLAGRAFGNLCFAAAIGNILGPPVAG